MSDGKPTAEADRQDIPPPKKGRGRPRKYPPTKPSDEPVVKRPRGRPPGSKNKKKKEKEKQSGPKRPRGRPRKWGVASEEKEEKSTSGTTEKDGNASE